MAGTRNFLGQKHTRQALRQGEMLLTQLAERRSWEAWEHEGRTEMAACAQAEAIRLLAEHQAPPLDVAQERVLDEIMHYAAKELVSS
jgi:trimethylamine:corrinoid methyltransferase-like protein